MTTDSKYLHTKRRTLVKRLWRCGVLLAFCLGMSVFIIVTVVRQARPDLVADVPADLSARVLASAICGVAFVCMAFLMLGGVTVFIDDWKDLRNTKRMIQLDEDEEQSDDLARPDSWDLPP